MRVWFVLLVSCFDLLAQGSMGVGLRNVACLQAMNPVLYPTQVSGLFMWLSADSGVHKDTGGTLCTADSDPVVKWVDQSGNGNDVGQTGGKNPKYRPTAMNGLPGLAFFSSQTFACTNWLTNAFSATLQIPYTVFIVYYFTNATDNWNPVVWSGYSAKSPGMIMGDGGYQGHVTFRSGGSAQYGWFGLQSKQWYQSTFIYNNSNSFGLSFASKYLQFAVPQNGWTNVLFGGYQSANPVNSPNESFIGMIAEFVVFSREVSSTERYGVEMYLKRKYALQEPF